ncbi:hypothetical protein DFH94DRAFT_724424 [Russula ochroleuca]|uniref:Uncharacterized protein n=1 Tax=Russula ochroleuca TaxID=152965 RepID=A0A9P5N177_9AGAM|nr:hypothetical protein DFH94DRAFT_724424 [Russula ochroleuca]
MKVSLHHRTSVILVYCVVATLVLSSSSAVLLRNPPFSSRRAIPGTNIFILQPYRSITYILLKMSCLRTDDHTTGSRTASTVGTLPF